MHTHDLSGWKHEHVFDSGNELAARGARAVMWITLVTMVVEIVAGWWFNSMALLADGWHMSSHALALGLSAFAYAAARRYARDPRFAFGTWKIEVLAGYTSAILLVCVAVLMVVDSIERLLAPQPVAYQEAMLVAVVGLVVNVVCAFILGDAHPHDDHDHHHHDHDHHDHHHHHAVGAHDHGHDHHHDHDLNLRSAYIHVVTDAATSVLAIVALAGGWLYGWNWLDPFMGIVGAALVAGWAYGLVVETAKVLLDREMDRDLVGEIRQLMATELASGETRLADLHVWRVGKQAYSVALVVVTHDNSLTPERVRQHLARHPEIKHATIEINRCCTEQSQSA